MPHPAVSQLTEIVGTISTIQNRRQLADLAEQMQNNLAHLAASLSDGDSRVPALEAELEDLRRCFNFHRKNGHVMIAGTASPDIQASTIDLRVPACAGITQVPFDVASVSAEVVNGDLHIHMKVNLA